MQMGASPAVLAATGSLSRLPFELLFQEGGSQEEEVVPKNYIRIPLPLRHLAVTRPCKHEVPSKVLKWARLGEPLFCVVLLGDPFLD